MKFNFEFVEGGRLCFYRVPSAKLCLLRIYKSCNCKPLQDTSLKFTVVYPSSFIHLLFGFREPAPHLVREENSYISSSHILHPEISKYYFSLSANLRSRGSNPRPFTFQDLSFFLMNLIINVGALHG